PRRVFWEAADVPGRERPTLRLLGDVDDWQAWPWELLHDGSAFLVREGRLDVVRSTPRRTEAPLVAATGPFRLVVNASARRGAGPLRYEEESWRLTRALSERCELTPTELGTLADLVETTGAVSPHGVHFSGHGGPGVLVFEDDWGDADEVPVGRL